MASFRFKRALFGYNRAAVDEAVEASSRDLNAARLEGAKAESALTEVRGELDYTRFSLVEARKESDARAERVRELEAVVAWLADRVVDREREMRAMVAEADGETKPASDQAEPASVPRTLPPPTRDPLIGDFKQSRRDGVVSAVRGAVERRQAEEAAAAQSEASAGAESNGDAADAVDAGYAPADGATGGEQLWTGQVALEVGPLSDFSQLAGLEDAAGGIDGASDISVRRFSKGRATIQLSLERPVDLLRELESRSPLSFEVRDTRSDRLVLDVES